MSKKNKKSVQKPEIEEVVTSRVVRHIEVPLAKQLLWAAEKNEKHGFAQAFLKAQGKL